MHCSHTYPQEKFTMTMTMYQKIIQYQCFLVLKRFWMSYQAAIEYYLIWSVDHSTQPKLHFSQHCNFFLLSKTHPTLSFLFTSWTLTWRSYVMWWSRLLEHAITEGKLDLNFLYYLPTCTILRVVRLLSIRPILIKISQSALISRSHSILHFMLDILVWFDFIANKAKEYKK